MSASRSGVDSSRVLCAAATAKRNSGAIRPSLKPLSTLSRSRRREGIRRSRTRATTGARSVGITTVAMTARIQKFAWGKVSAPNATARTRDKGSAISSSRAVIFGSLPKKPPSTSVASTNRTTARTTSTKCSMADVSSSRRYSGSDPAVRATPAATMAMGAVMLHRASRPATNPHARGMSNNTARASTGQLSHVRDTTATGRSADERRQQPVPAHASRVCARCQRPPARSGHDFTRPHDPGRGAAEALRHHPGARRRRPRRPAKAPSSVSSARTAPARPPPSASSPRCSRPTPARAWSAGTTSPPSRTRSAAPSG